MDDVETIQLIKGRKFYTLPVFILYLSIDVPTLVSLFFIDRESQFAEALHYIILVVSLVSKFTLAISAVWFTQFRVKLFYLIVSDIKDCQHVHVVPRENKGSSKIIKLEKKESSLYFCYQKLKYHYKETDTTSNDTVQPQFQLETLPLLWKNQDFVKFSKGHTLKSHKEAIDKFGKNFLDIEIPSFKTLFLERCSNPFFIFQIVCVFLWTLYEYWMYPVFTGCMLIMFESMLVNEQIKNLKLVYSLGNKEYEIRTMRDSTWSFISTNLLVVGDLVCLTKGVVPADLVLIKGACIVDESMLTGEAIPVNKESLNPSDFYTHETFNVESPCNKINLLFSGTEIIQSVSSDKKNQNVLAVVVKTSFRTEQGNLLRTILYGSKRVTENNKETLLFILFLLSFALAAASYLLYHGFQDDKRSRYRLLLEAALVITNVVPPELPLQLSLAVNSSLVSLLKNGIYCTEPFRIPYSGKLDICFFDKTGTLTDITPTISRVTPFVNCVHSVTDCVDKLPQIVIKILGCCHSIMVMNKVKVGDPMEIKMMEYVRFDFSNESNLVCRHPGFKDMRGVDVIRKFHFSSALGRMSVVVSDSPGKEFNLYVKGSPERILEMLHPDEIPENYTLFYKQAAYRGSRVIALAHRTLPSSLAKSSMTVLNMSRDAAETGCKFAGFVEISTLVKPESISTINVLHHYMKLRNVIITGDNLLTATFVAREIGLLFKGPIYEIIKIDVDDKGQILGVVLKEIAINATPTLVELNRIYNFKEFAINGSNFKELQKVLTGKVLFNLIKNVRIFARMLPKQKEKILTFFKKHNCTTLMCGDGTNDVGALKQAHVGLALLSFTKKHNEKNTTKAKRIKEPIKNKTTKSSKAVEIEKERERIEKLLKIDIDQPTIVKLGDASIAAPFTSKIANISTVTKIIYQGRSTLITTLQMFKILAINALILAYSQSVLYIDEIRFSDTQSTLQGMMLIGCFLFITRSKPLSSKVATDPPPCKIFTIHSIVSIISQFAFHLFALIYVSQICKALSPLKNEAIVTLDDDSIESLVNDELEEVFIPSLIKSCIYVVSTALQIITFAVNYKGHPYNESLYENKPMFYSVVFSSFWTFCLLFNVVQDISDYMELVEIPNQIKMTIFGILISDLLLSFCVDRILSKLLSKKTRLLEL